MEKITLKRHPRLLLLLLADSSMLSAAVYGSERRRETQSPCRHAAPLAAACSQPLRLQSVWPLAELAVMAELAELKKLTAAAAAMYIRERADKIVPPR